MQILHTKSNIFDLPVQENCGVCVTTNGIRKSNGHAVMGAGIAKEANQRFHCSGLLGHLLQQSGNHVYDLGVVSAPVSKPYHLISFPTKHDWKQNSDLQLIQQSANELIGLCNHLHLKTCYLTQPGCACGHLDWQTQVKPVLESILDDRFIIVIRA